MNLADLALKKREEMTARKHLHTLIQPCPSYEGYILAVFPRKWQKFDHFLALGKKNVCVITVAKQLSLQSILTVLVFQLPEFFLPK